MRGLKSIAVAGVALALSAGSAAAADTLRIGLMTTLSGGGAILGEELKRGWDIGLESLGGKIGGVPTEITVVDDEAKPEVAVTAIDRLVNQNKVQVVAGVVWANVLIAVYDAVTKADTVLMSTNAGPNIAAGKSCSPLFITTSFQSDQTSEATAALVEGDGVKSVYMVAPNYQIGKDIISVFKRGFKGEVAGETLFKLGQTDFSAELSEIRNAHPESVMAFAPGAMAIAFLKQWQSLGLSKTTKLYTLNMVDELTLPAVGDAANGSRFVSVYDETQNIPANKKFVDAFMAKYKRLPTEYAAKAYDGVLLLDAGVRGLGGKVDDRKALVAEMRKANFASVRGPLRYNVNNYPIEDMYKLEVTAGADGKPSIKGAGVIVKDQADPYYKDCGLRW